MSGPICVARLASRAALAISTLPLLVACNDGYLGELRTKPAYGNMSGLYYHVMCKPDSPEYSHEPTRALRIEMDTGQCAVLYLDGVELDGDLMIYPGGVGNQPACSKALRNKLEWYEAHQVVMVTIGALCGWVPEKPAPAPFPGQIPHYAEGELSE